MKNIPQFEPWFDEKEISAITDYMKSGGWLTEFKKTEEFENLIADYTGTKHCVAVNNGTISLTLAALAAGIQYGDEVIVPNYTMIATSNSIKMIGGVPVFVDVERDTLCMDIDQAKKAITDKTKALILVTANGRYPVAGITAFEELCAENGIVLIEDSAQSLGSFYPDGRHMGTAGKIGSFSFSMPKIITTGQGGALITNDDDLAFKLHRLKDFGRSGGGLDIHDSIGYNFKFTDLQAVIGIEQMKKLEYRVERKKEILSLYRKLLESIPQVRFFEQDLKHTTPWFIDVIAEDRDGLIKHLKNNGIGSRVMYPPINKQEAYDLEGYHPVSEVIGRNGLWLPSANQLIDEEVEHICGTINSYY
jgi:perosamine synthetase